eukprot:GHVO01041082.1.p1 GENE.GHVO01041082.1~~GHVO01041082.1.p1  ORF type:complete len:482 (-),score=62.49 GHVO01041082.1:2-1447(-)
MQCCRISSLKKVLCIAFTGAFIFGWNLAVLNTLVTTINLEFGWCDGNMETDCNIATHFSGVIGASVFIGGVVGSAVGPRFLLYGRRMSCMMAGSVMILGTITTAFSNNFISLLVGRLLCGFAVGSLGLYVPMLIAECSPAVRRGTYGVAYTFGITTGIFVSILLGLAFDVMPEEQDDDWRIGSFNKAWWRVIIAIGILPCILFLWMLMYVFPYDTPYYYAESGDYESAEKVLKILRDENDVTEEIQGIIQSTKESQQTEQLSLFKAFFHHSDYRLAILAGLCVVCLFQLSGVNVFTTQSNMLFEDAGLTGSMVTTASTILTLVNALVVIPSAWLIEWYGRRTLAMIGTAGQTLCLLPATILYLFNAPEQISESAQTYCAIVGAVGFLMFFSGLFGPVVYVFLFEIYPADIKGKATSFAIGAHWACAVATIYVNQYVSVGMAYAIFTVTNFAAFLVAVFLMRETKGRSIQDSPYFPKALSDD